MTKGHFLINIYQTTIPNHVKIGSIIAKVTTPMRISILLSTILFQIVLQKPFSQFFLLYGLISALASHLSCGII